MAEGLTEQQRLDLKQRLRQRLIELRKDVREGLLKLEEEQYIELAGRVHDAEEESVADLLADVNLAVVDLHVNEIRDVEFALARIDTEAYGVCSDCERTIDYARLQVQPTARRCHDCQTRYERSYSQQNRPKF